MKESFAFISGNKNREKIPYISGKGTFLYFGKRFIFQEVISKREKFKKSTLKKSLIFRQMELSSPKLKKLTSLNYFAVNFWKLSLSLSLLPIKSPVLDTAFRIALFEVGLNAPVADCFCLYLPLTFYLFFY